MAVHGPKEKMRIDKLVSRPRNEIKKALMEGKLVAGLDLIGTEVILQLHEAYRAPEKYRSINHVFYKLHREREAFRALFKKPKTGLHRPALRLAQSGNTSNESVWKAFQAAIVPKEPICFKKLLADGKLLAGVQRHSKEIVLFLKEEYDDIDNYVSITRAFSNLYNHSEAFQEKYLPPKQSVDTLVLTLKAEPVGQDEASLLSELIGFAQEHPLKDSLLSRTPYPAVVPQPCEEMDPQVEGGLAFFSDESSASLAKSSLPPVAEKANLTGNKQNPMSVQNLLIDQLHQKMVVEPSPEKNQPGISILNDHDTLAMTRNLILLYHQQLQNLPSHNNNSQSLSEILPPAWFGL